MKTSDLWLKLIVLFTLLFITTKSIAQDTFTFEGINYTITDANKVEVGNNSNNEDLIKVDIPEIVKYNGCKYAVMSIGKEAFNNCSKLTLINIPNRVTSIGDNAFLVVQV